MEPDDSTTAEAVADPDSFEARVNGIAALGEPLRRSLYRYVTAQAGPVNRDQAAEGAGVARHVAKFHLDRLVDDGLLEVEYRRAPGKRGPGAGRPAKFYRRSSHEIAVSLPERHYELAGKLLAQAITDAEREGQPVADSLRAAARDVGHGLGEKVREQAGARAGRKKLLAATADVLRGCGYEPRQDAGGMTLVNCPFHALAQDYTELVCGMNLELMNGLVERVEGSTLEARLEPEPGQCCVRLREGSKRSAVPGSATGGDPACWADLVCPECGAVTSEGHHRGCAADTR